MDLKTIRISAKKQEILANMNIHCVEDLLTYYPFRYENIEAVPFAQWQKDDKIATAGIIVTRAHVIRLGGKRSITKFKIMNKDGEFDVSLFNRPWVSQFKYNETITIIGKYDGKNKITALQYNFKPLQEQLGMTPVYTVREGITQRDIRNYVDKAWQAAHHTITDLIPEDLRTKYRLITRKESIYFIHHPDQYESVKQALRYLKYEEFFRFQLVMQAMKAKETVVVKGHAKQFAMEDVWELKHALSFSLTADQQKAIEDILQDLASDQVMYRMVQGDVGCGKTLVAAFGLYACILAHKQAALMAPTEILAKQHGQSLKKLFRDFDVQVEVLYSSLKSAEKAAILKRLANNEIDILVGTHALFQEEVQFYDLGMVVADEQHRFGVGQRRRLIEKGDKVDFLLMSATPIPRTLALSLYGDMDVSTIQELPQGRMPITTKLIHSASMGPILNEVLEKIDEGNQCYVVCPAIEKNEETNVKNVTDIYMGMKSSLGKKYTIELLHGKMNAQEKDDIMNRFKAQEIHILVSTTVIEVGVDVPSANIMVIYDAHRFGLSQIHQLRGRIGRGNQKGWCYLLSATKEEESLRRLKILVKTSDGFEIAHYDLALRGPGDILGTRQSGVPGFILGDVVQDVKILEVARDDAAYVLAHIDQYPAIERFVSEQLPQESYLD